MLKEMVGGVKGSCRVGKVGDTGPRYPGREGRLHVQSTWHHLTINGPYASQFIECWEWKA